MRAKLDQRLKPIGFRIWRWWSSRRFGSMRSITYRSKQFNVLSEDWRAYWLATSDDVNPHTRAQLSALLDLRPQLYIDVGANYGEFVADAVQRGIATVAVEANPDVARCLRSTFHACDDVEILAEAAIREGDGEVLLATLPGLTGFSSMTASVLENKTGPAKVRSNIRLVPVRARTLESMVGTRALNSVVMKIDVEGHEVDVVEGAVALLGRVADWWAILLEFDPDFLGQRALRPSEEFNKLIAIAPALGEFVGDRIVWRPARPSDCPRAHSDILLGSGSFLEH